MYLLRFSISRWYNLWVLIGSTVKLWRLFLHPGKNSSVVHCSCFPSPIFWAFVFLSWPVHPFFWKMYQHTWCFCCLSDGSTPDLADVPNFPEEKRFFLKLWAFQVLSLFAAVTACTLLGRFYTGCWNVPLRIATTRASVRPGTGDGWLFLDHSNSSQRNWMVFHHSKERSYTPLAGASCWTWWP